MLQSTRGCVAVCPSVRPCVCTCTKYTYFHVQRVQLSQSRHFVRLLAKIHPRKKKGKAYLPTLLFQHVRGTTLFFFCCLISSDNPMPNFQKIGTNCGSDRATIFPIKMAGVASSTMLVSINPDAIN